MNIRRSWYGFLIFLQICHESDFRAIFPFLPLLIESSSMVKYRYVVTMIFLLISCIGVDYEDDPIVGERIEVDQQQVALRVNETHQVEATFYDQYGLQKSTALMWSSSNSTIASVNQQGLITAHLVGQVSVLVTANTAELAIAVNVVLDDNQVARVEIAAPQNQNTLGIDETILLSASVKNIENMILTERSVEWFSENASIATVNNQGVVTGTGQGMVDIHAKSEGVKSNIITLSVGQGRSGSFISAGGYKAVGMAKLSVMDNKLILELSNNFETSFALGTYIYLANTTNGAQVRASGLEIAQITTNGAKTFNVSAISPTTGLLDYKYAIILCKPASVTFGYAEFK